MPDNETAETPQWLNARLADDGTPLSAQLYRRLREAIVQGQVAPGQPLHEPAIAKAFGTSRTPVREAFMKLRDEALVEIRRQSGTFVSEIDPRLVEQGMLVRESLEPKLAAIAAKRISKAQIRALALETDEMAAAVVANDSARFIDADDRYHRLIVDASGFAHIAQIIDRVNAPLDRLRYLSVSEPKRAKTAIREHRQLIKMLGDRDGPACAKQIESHLQGSWIVIRDLLAQNHER